MHDMIIHSVPSKILSYVTLNVESLIIQYQWVSLLLRKQTSVLGIRLFNLIQASQRTTERNLTIVQSSRARLQTTVVKEWLEKNWFRHLLLRMLRPWVSMKKPVRSLSCLWVQHRTVFGRYQGLIRSVWFKSSKRTITEYLSTKVHGPKLKWSWRKNRDMDRS